MSKTNDQTHRRYFQVKRFQDRLQGREGQILLGAFKNMVEAGISGTTIRSVAAYAGLNSGIIHYYFRSKDHLLSRLLEVLYESVIDNIKGFFAADLSPTEKMDAIFEFGLSTYEIRAEEWIVLTSFWAHSMSRHGNLLIQHRKLNRRLRTAVIKGLQELTGDARLQTRKDIALLLIGAVEGLAHQYVLDPKGFAPQRLVNLLKGAFRIALGQGK